MRALHILENSPQQLIAVQTAPSVRWLFLFFATAAVVGAVLSLRKHFWKGVVLAACMLLLFSLLAALPKPATYRVDIDFGHGAITSEGTRDGAVVSSFVVNGRTLSAAELQSNRGANAIVLIRQDGSLIFPLGEEQVQHEPDQYVVLTALRRVIRDAERQSR